MIISVAHTTTVHCVFDKWIAAYTFSVYKTTYIHTHYTYILCVFIHTSLVGVNYHRDTRAGAMSLVNYCIRVRIYIIVSRIYMYTFILDCLSRIIHMRRTLFACTSPFHAYTCTYMAPLKRNL